jgi:hypothetical protein
MSLLDVLRSAVVIADQQTKAIQATVKYRHYVSSSDEGDAIYNPPVGQPELELKAIVDWKQKMLRTMEGEQSVSRAVVTFLDVNAVAAATNNEGFDDNDIIILPDGTTGPILDMSGFIDAGTGQPLATEVFLG